MAINGNGFFVVAKPTGFTDNQPTFSGINDYTRHGDFKMNEQRQPGQRRRLLSDGHSGRSDHRNPLGSLPQVLQFNNNFLPAQATTSVNYQANLPSAPPTGLLTPRQLQRGPRPSPGPAR